MLRGLLCYGSQHRYHLPLRCRCPLFRERFCNFALKWRASLGEIHLTAPPCRICQHSASLRHPDPQPRYNNYHSPARPNTAIFQPLRSEPTPAHHTRARTRRAVDPCTQPKAPAPNTSSENHKQTPKSLDIFTAKTNRHKDLTKTPPYPSPMPSIYITPLYEHARPHKLPLQAILRRANFARNCAFFAQFQRVFSTSREKKSRKMTNFREKLPNYTLFIDFLLIFT